MDGSDGAKGAKGAPGQKGLAGIKGQKGEKGISGEKGDKGNDGKCNIDDYSPCNCDTHVVTRHSQSVDTPDCPAEFTSLWSGYSLVFFEGNGYGLSQDLGDAGSCLEDFQLLPFMQCSASDVCRHGVRTDKSFWLGTNQGADFASKPMNNIDEILPHISRCRVCMGTKYIIARHSFKATAPACPADFSEIWTGYSYVMVTSSSTSGGGQDLSSAGSCLENFFLPTFIECLGRGTCSYYINNLDYWLAQNQETNQPGMWGMGNVYSGLADILDQGVSRCVVCARNSL